LIISASIFEVMESQDVELWEHSLGCAVASSVLAKHLGVKDPEEASTAGLIHDIGKVAIKMELPEEHVKIHLLVRNKGVSVLEAEQELLGFDHAEVGGWLAKAWNLPARLVNPIAWHHAPVNAKSEQLIAAIVHFSDIMIRGMGYGHGYDVWVPRLDKDAWKILDMTPENFDQIIEMVEGKLWDVKGFSLEVQVNSKQDEG
jgi:putative nucleotidyltransferase with HDIG domain